MGSGTSQDITKTIYVSIAGKRQKIIFSRDCTTSDVLYLLSEAAGVSQGSRILLKDNSGALLVIAPTIPTNTRQTSYVLTAEEVKEPAIDTQPPLRHILSDVVQQIKRINNNEGESEKLVTRISALEMSICNGHDKLIGIEQCKTEIARIKKHMKEAQGGKTSIAILKQIEDVQKVYSRSNPTYLKYIMSQETLEYLKKPTFDVWDWTTNEMVCLLEQMYTELNLVETFKIDPTVLRRWLHRVDQSYRNIPFHNFRHCFCVTQMMYGIIHICDMRDKLSIIDIVILITACICHDLDHPGYNNSYQINAKTELALRYNNKSPLENHHCAVAFQILGDPDTNIFANTDSTTYSIIRSGIILLVLATDMSKHTENLSAFRSNISSFDFKNKEHMQSLMRVMIKCCDISNEVRPSDVSDPWVDCLLEEYFIQSDHEKAKGLPVAAFMDRDKVTKPSAQIGFIKFVLIPMFDTLTQLFPQLLEAMVAPLQESLSRYEVMPNGPADNQKMTPVVEIPSRPEHVAAV